MTRTLCAGLCLLAGLAALLVPLYVPDSGTAGLFVSGFVGVGLTLIGASHV